MTTIGIIGAGAIGQKHAVAAQQAGAAVRWVVDVDALRAEDLAASCGASAATTPEALLADADVDAVVIGVPNRWHHRLALAALEAGKDVLLEKPMATSAEQCAEINAAAERAGRMLQVGYVHRYTSVGRTALELVNDGTLGEIYHAKAQLWLRRGVPGLGKRFTTKRESGGGALMDVGVHLIDLALHLLGFPEAEEVTGQVYSNFGRRMRDYVFESMWAGPPDWDGVCDVEDAAHALVRFRSGATLSLDVAWAGNFPATAMPTSLVGLFGDRGGMAFQLFGDHVDLTVEEDGAVVDRRVDAAERDAFHEQFLDFQRAVLERRCFGPTGQEGLVVQSIVDRVYGSSLPAPAPVEA